MKKEENIDRPEASYRHDWRARLLGDVLKTLIVLCIVYELASLLPGFSDNPWLGVAVIGGLLVVLVGCLVLQRRGRVKLSIQIFLACVFLAGTVAVVSYGGMLGSNWVVFPSLLICAGMLAGRRSVLIYGGLSTLVLAGMAAIEHFDVEGVPIHPQQVVPAGLVVLSCLVLGAVFMAYALRLLDQAEREREAFERQRMEASRLEAVGQLAGGVAHDFNNLMMAVMANAEFLAEHPALGADEREQVAQIRQAGQRASELTRQLLAFARRQVLKPRVLDLNEVISGIEHLVRRLLREDIQLAIHPGPDLPAVRADPAQLEQVVLNLVINARDAMPGGGRLTVETGAVEFDRDYCRSHAGTVPGRYVALVVSDTGTGMSPETQDRIFEPFYSTKQGRGGTGLGLSTVWGIVQQSGGHMRVYSEPGHGSTFKVYLPAASGRPEKSVVPAERASEPAGGGELVLVVDDEPMVRKMNGRMLERYGYRPLLAGSGEQAREIARKQSEPIALLITDVVMPGLGGPALAASLQEDDPGLRVLYVSGYAENAIVHQGELDPDLHFLAKPYTPQRLAQKVREVLDSTAEKSPPDKPA